MANDYRFIGSPAKAGGSPFKVMLATPVSRDPCCAYTVSLAAAVHALAVRGIEAHVYLHQGNCHVDDARNTMIRDFLETDCTDLFFLDADLGWRPHSIVRMIEVPGDVVAGVYCHRSPGETYPFHPGEGVRESNEHGLFEMHKVPTGFMRIRRNVVEALYDAEMAKGRKFWWRPDEQTAGRKPITRIVERGFASELDLAGMGGSNSDYHSGDYVLCMKARKLGFKCWVDIDHWFEHVGEQAFSGHLGNKLRRDQKVPSPQFVAAVNELKAGNDKPEVFKRLFHAFGRSEWPMSAPGLYEIWHQAKATGGHVLETGSGLSTLVLGLALAGTDRVVYALEHDLKYFDETALMLNQHQVGNVMMTYSPLMPFDDGFKWYAVDTDDLPEAFGLALIDGPPQYYGREGVMRVLGDRLTDAVLVIDDIGNQADRIATPGHDVRVVPCERAFGVATPKQAQAAAAE